MILILQIEKTESQEMAPIAQGDHLANSRELNRKESVCFQDRPVSLIQNLIQQGKAKR